MTDTERKIAAKKFVKDWKNADYEMGQSQDFWRDLVSRVYGESDIGFIEFEKRVKVDGTIHRIDAFIKSTRVLIEQKSGDVNLLAPQAREGNRTPYEQALNYIKGLSVDLSPRWIITCNFKEFYIYDMSKAEGERMPTHILLKDLADQYKCLHIIVDEKNRDAEKEFNLSWEAGKKVGKLYNELLKCYPCPESDKTKKDLNILCVRLVFCLYAEDAGLFNEYHQFKSFIKSVPANYLHLALKELFTALNTPINARKNVSNTVAAFPYVNGGLFEADIEIPVFNDETADILLEHAEFDWSKISPTIFGALFESTLNPETRDENGMHYTSIETIHKVIDPLFLDELKAELENIISIKELKKRDRALEAYRDKLSKLTFLDPACGSGNFLTETYISLRRLENIALAKWLAGKSIIDNNDIIKVNIKQFYGIEINDFAVTVAKTALWIAASQMMKETEELVLADLNFLPLKENSNIFRENALRIDWKDVIFQRNLNYIIGNPPFKGARQMTSEQKEDIRIVFEGWRNAGNLDYVACWYKKAVEYICGTAIRASFVSTNSVTQGEQVALLWKPLFNLGAHIDFAHQTFKWDSEAIEMAHVHCVVVGFSTVPTDKPKLLYFDGHPQIAKNINGYLLNASNLFIENRATPISSVPEINYGSFALDDGNYTISQNEYAQIEQQDRRALKFLRPFLGAYELLHNKNRYCIWLKGANPAEVKDCPIVLEKVRKVQEWRSHSSRTNTVALATTPMQFAEIRQPNTDYLAVPTICSEKRRYLPIAFLSSNIIASNQLYVVPNAELYHFGILMSNVHNAWMRVVCGRLETRYRYSSGVVYNNFPWCSPTAEQRARIEQTARAILDARALYPDCCLADLYGEDMGILYPTLLKAHTENDKAVMEAYGFSTKMSESECVAELMKMYQKKGD